MSRVEAIISDFGGVLTSPLEDAFRGFAADSGIALEALGTAMATYGAELGANPLYELETGRLAEREFLTGVGDALRADGHPGANMDAFAQHYFAHLHPNQELFDYFRSLRDGGLRLALCTNNVREWEPRWRVMLPIDEIFETVVDSGFVGVRKPDAEIYQLTLERLGGIAPERVVFVDDFEHNCEAARALGMTAVRFATTEQAIADIDAAVRG
jgi:epoxide hydrolase-like predicted phosphatase